jgi:hypothetical protein
MKNSTKPRSKPVSPTTRPAKSPATRPKKENEKGVVAKALSMARLAANRANARKSTGPATPEGKARSSRNAFKHGLLSSQLVSRDNDPDERLADLRDLVDGLIAEYQPDGPVERLLVERIAACYWRLRRALRFEGQSILAARRDVDTPLERLGRELTGTQIDPYSIVLPRIEAIDKLIRYEAMIDRQLNNCLAQLQFLQATRPRSPIPAPDIAGPQSTSPASAVCNPQPAIHNGESAICNMQSAISSEISNAQISNPQISNPQSAAPPSAICNMQSAVPSEISNAQISNLQSAATASAICNMQSAIPAEVSNPPSPPSPPATPLRQTNPSTRRSAVSDQPGGPASPPAESPVLTAESAVAPNKPNASRNPDPQPPSISPPRPKVMWRPPTLPNRANPGEVCNEQPRGEAPRAESEKQRASASEEAGTKGR